MRPIRLTMEAFGSYGEKTVIDFSKLNQNLFLISGETGSGKSTIFDAISFALYGAASSMRNKKDGVELQSDYAETVVTPYVELVFSKKEGNEEQIYTVRREPKHNRKITRKTKTGNDTRDVSEKVVLTMPDGTEYPQKESNEKIIELIGLTRSQFAQIVMIAQGEFMELLRADSKTKKEIFRKLFGTEIYEQILEELKKRCKNAEEQQRDIYTGFRSAVMRVRIPSEYEKADEMKSLQKQISKSDKADVVANERFVELLSELCLILEKEKQGAEDIRKKRKETLDHVSEEYTSAQTLLKSYMQFEEALRILKQCEEHEPEIEKIRSLSSRILSAYEIQNLYRIYEEAYAEVEDTEKKLHEQEWKLPEISRAAADAKKEEEIRRTEMQNAQLAFGKTESQVTEALARFDEIRKYGSKVAQTEEYAAKAAKAFLEAKERLEQQEQQIADWKSQMDKISDAELCLEKCKGRKRELEKILLMASDAEQELQKIDVWKQKREEAVREFEAANALYKEKKTAYDHAYDRFIHEQAGLLAAKLVEGEPCPVCGSTVHPNPCTFTEKEEDISQDALDVLLEEVEQLRKEETQKANASSWTKEHLEEQMQRYKECYEHLCAAVSNSDINGGILDPLSLSEIKEALEKQNSELQKEEKKRIEEAEALSRIREKIREAEGKTEHFKQNVERTRDREKELNAEWISAKTSYQSLLEIQKDYASEDEAKKALEDAKTVRQKAERLHREASICLERETKEKQNAEALIEEYQKILPAQKEKRDEKKHQYDQILKEKSMTESEWKNTASTYSKDQTDVYSKEIERHEKQKLSASTQKENAKNIIGDRKVPDMEKLEDEKRMAETAWQSADANLTEIREIYSGDISVNRELNRNQEIREREGKRYIRLQSLCDRLDGKRSGARMDLETFVQRYHLARILDAANERFRDMTEGQFELRMMPEEQAGAGKNRGLDLMVYSSVTGKEREIRTLSGGESFMAALALSLGIADQIQAGSAVNLDMMFIDEGFGSLSANARAQAVHVLQKMSSGSKMIGIISHVSELAQVIEDQLIVTKNEKGSHVRWEIS